LVRNIKISDKEDGTWEHVKKVCDDGKKLDRDQVGADEIMK